MGDMLDDVGDLLSTCERCAPCSVDVIIHSVCFLSCSFVLAFVRSFIHSVADAASKETAFLVRIFHVFLWTCSKLEHGITRKAG